MKCPHCNQEDKLLIRSDNVVMCWNCQKRVKLGRIKKWLLKRRFRSNGK